MVEARKDFAAGKIDDAEKKAYRAQKMHGPYGVFDFGDRPQKLLEEVQRLRQVRNLPSPSPSATDNKDAPAAKDLPRTAPPSESALAQNANKNRAIVMVRAARELERQGQAAGGFTKGE